MDRPACEPGARSLEPFLRPRGSPGRSPAASRPEDAGVLEQPRALLRRAEDDRPAAEDPRRDGSLQRSWVGGERHPRRDVGGHHPVLGDRDQQQVEEVALLLGRLLAGEQQVEVLGEAQPAHQVAGEVASPHLDPVGVGLADSRDWAPGLHTREPTTTPKTATMWQWSTSRWQSSGAGRPAWPSVGSSGG